MVQIFDFDSAYCISIRTYIRIEIDAATGAVRRIADNVASNDGRPRLAGSTMRARILKATVGAILKMEAGTLSHVSSAPSTADEDGADRNGISPRATRKGFVKVGIKDFCQLK